MGKFHINGAGEVNHCQAQPGNCPLSPESEHFGTPEEARAHFESKNGSGLGSIQSQAREGFLHFEKGSIFMDVAKTGMGEFYDYLESKVTSEEFKEILANKESRDGETFHITAVNYKELKNFTKLTKSRPELPKESFSYRIRGVGSAQNEVSRAFYCVVTSPAIQNFRASLDLPPADLHITLGYIGPKDVYNASKGVETLI